MNVVKIVFSPTGGTQKVADALAEELAKDGGSISQIDLSDPAMEKADLCVDADALAVSPHRALLAVCPPSSWSVLPRWPAMAQRRS